MDRRQFLQAAGGLGVTAAGGYGIYTTFIQDQEFETREGWLLSGVAPARQDLSVLDPFEEWLGQRHAVVGSFVDMGIAKQEIETAVFGGLETKWHRGQIPHIWWQPFFPDRESTSQEVTREIANGEYDETIQVWADTLADWAISDNRPDRRMYINLAPEMNGDWSPWSPGVGDDTEEDFVAMWRRIHDILSDAGLESDHVQWVWALDTTTRGVDREAVYPGDEYVDWAGLHGYNWSNWGRWGTPQEVYGRSIEVIRSITDKPLAITEFGCSSETEDGGHAPGRKNTWIADAYEYFQEEDVRMALWFNIDIETDWAVFNSDYGVGTTTVDGTEYNIYPNYKKAVTSDGVLGPYPDHPRGLTDEEFAGEF